MFIATRKALLGASLAVLAAALSTKAMAQQRRFDIPAQDAATAVTAFGLQAGVQISAPVGQLRAVKTAALRGDMDARAALKQLIAGTGLVIAQDDGRTIVLQMRPQSDGAGSGPDEAAQVAEVVVTGSRIRGAPPAAPVILRTQKQMLEEGQTNLGDVVRTVPQSFGGGQNPGISGNQGAIVNQNVTSGSSLNLRGLGPDATLTLLNGHRVAYDGAFQAVDVSVIPVAAVERLEIVADGASAIYGSDAVGGVANIILKRDYEGVATSARFGASTDGGNDQRQYNIVGGRTWTSGGFMAVVDYSKSSAVDAGDRSYTKLLNPGQTLLPELSQSNFVAAMHQAVNEVVTVSADATYSKRNSLLFTARTVISAPTFEGFTVDVDAESYSISPRLDFRLGGGWTGALFGTHGESESNSSNLYIAAGKFNQDARNRLLNITDNLEAGLEGPLFSINGNQARIAAGAGYRKVQLEQVGFNITPTTTQNIVNYNKSNSSSFGFFEAFVPVIAPQNDLMVDRLSFSAAGRYEDYDSESGIFTPKLGLIFAPIADVEFKGTWGKSFKAPQLLQQNANISAFYYYSSLFGGGFPSTSTAVLLTGGNPGLRSERATSWTASVKLQPRFIPKLQVELSYFDVDYKDRIIEPFASLGAAFSTAGLQSLITYRPTAAQINAAIALAPGGAQVGTAPLPINPTDLAAIIDDRFANISSQQLHGFDVSGNYAFDLGSTGSLVVNAGASHLESHQISNPGQPVTALAGTIYDPPEWRGRAGVTWTKDGLTFNTAATYLGSFYDDRRVPSVKVGSITTVDMTARYATNGTGLFGGVELALSALNVFNEKPRTIRASSATARAYDSTQDSVVGRFVAVSISKQW